MSVAAAFSIYTFLAGVVAHVTFYRYGEWDKLTVRICAIYLSIVSLLCVLLVGASDKHTRSDFALWSSSLALAVKLTIPHLAGIFSSITMYRLFFHRLRHYPGPLLARVTGWYWTYLFYRSYHVYDEMKALHDKHGDIVRIGPNTLSIIHPAASQAIYGSASQCSKTAFHDFALPKVLLNTERNKLKHATRRRTWEYAFNVKALKSYEPIMNLHASQLVATIKAHLDKSVNIADTINHYAFNLMSHFAFSKTFTDSPEDVSHQRLIISVMHSGGSILGFFHLVPWVCRLLRAIPVNPTLTRFDAYGEQLVRERRAMKPENPDVLGWMLEKFEQAPVKTKEMEEDLVADAMTISIAGTDTTAAALTACFWHLACHPEAVKKLREELEACQFDVKTPDHAKLAQAPYLKATVDETLRVSPPTPVTGIQRKTPPAGLQIGEMVVPGDVDVFVPIYVAHHDERFFVHAEDWIPERWIERKGELMRDGATFMPFNLGTYGCVGKALAQAEIRLTVAILVSLFDVAPAAGMTKDKFHEEQRDMLTMMYGDVELVFRDRSQT